jgi:hypothetical protein
LPDAENVDCFRSYELFVTPGYLSGTIQQPAASNEIVGVLPILPTRKRAPDTTEHRNGTVQVCRYEPIFEANKAKLEKQGVNVKDRVQSSKGLKLPERAPQSKEEKEH